MDILFWFWSQSLLKSILACLERCSSFLQLNSSIILNPVGVLHNQLSSSFHVPVRLDDVSNVYMSVPEQYIAINEKVMSNLVYTPTSVVLFIEEQFHYCQKIWGNKHHCCKISIQSCIITTIIPLSHTANSRYTKGSTIVNSIKAPM